jgi:putative ABC transport system permease protein
MDEILAMLDEMETDEFLAKLEEMGLITADTIPAAYRKKLNKDMIRRLIAQSGAAGVEGSAGKNLKTLGVSDADSPSAIYIYPRDFEAKERVTEIIDGYNAEAADEQVIRYTDYVGLLMSSVTTIINAISYVLIAFVAISLVVSSIMIGIITYISVLERTKEIGILRSIGASRKDISRVFNAETLIIGFTAGAIGIGVTLLLVLLVNIILQRVTGIVGIAMLPPAGAVILVLISMGLTLIAGIIPSRIAARKDPVVALRTE